VDNDRFDGLARRLTHPTSRRTTFVVLASTMLGMALPSSEHLADAKGKHHHHCPPCQRKKKGTCQVAKPDGTRCGEEKICVAGACVSRKCDPPCKAPETCVNGTCGCHNPAEVCGDRCCAEAVECTDQGVCACEERLCSCPGDEFICRVGIFSPPYVFEQCCLPGDVCDKSVGCATETCSVANSYCQAEWAGCGANAKHCACFTTMTGEPICADAIGLTGFTLCPSTSECTADADCVGSLVCVNLSCCDPEGADFGVCLHPCRGASAADRAHERQSLVDLKRNRPAPRP